MTGARNVRGGLLLLCVGLAAGLVMSLYAFRPLVPVPESLARYDDLPRRLLRLGHIAAIMLPLINVVLGPWLDRLRLPAFAAQAASWLLLAGAAALPAALALEAFVPPLIFFHLSAVPALIFCAGVFLAGAGACRTDFTAIVDKEDSHAGSHRRRAQDLRDHPPLLQERAR
jgi:hypothetical protein